MKIDPSMLLDSMHVCGKIPALMQALMCPRPDVDSHYHAVDDALLEGVQGNRLGQRPKNGSCCAHLRQVCHGLVDYAMKRSLGFVGACYPDPVTIEVQGHVAFRLDAGSLQDEIDAHISIVFIDAQPVVSRTEHLGSLVEQLREQDQWVLNTVRPVQLVPCDAGAGGAACAAWCCRWCCRWCGLFR